MIRGFETTEDNVKKAKKELERKKGRKKGRLKEQSLRIRNMTENEVMR